MNNLKYYLRQVFYLHLIEWGLFVLFSLFAFYGRDFNNGKYFGYLGLVLFIILLVFFFKNRSTSLLDTDKINDSLNDLFKNSERFLYIVSAYFDAGENRLNNIYIALKNNAKVIILVRDGIKKKDTANQLSKLKDKGCDVRLHPDLHSKIFLNEKLLIIASANLWESSFNNNLEFGVRTENSKIIEEIKSKIETDYFGSDKTTEFIIEDVIKSFGYCIKSKREIRFNQRIPFSRIEWDKIPRKDRDNNPSGNYCHRCGKEALTSRNNPLCDEHK